MGSCSVLESLDRVLFNSSWHIPPLQLHLAYPSSSTPIGISLLFSSTWHIPPLQLQLTYPSSSAPLGISLLAPLWCHRSVWSVCAAVGDPGVIYTCCPGLPAGCSRGTLGQPCTCNNIRNTRNTWSRPATRPATTGRLGDTHYQHGSVSRQGHFLLPRFCLSTL